MLRIYGIYNEGEIYEKTGIKEIDIYFSNIFSKVNRSPIMRMVAISYVGIVDNKKMDILNETLKTNNGQEQRKKSQRTCTEPK